MAALLSAFDDNLTCPICLEWFTKPKQLPCMHRFCHGCLSSYIRTENAAIVTCPKCRQAVRLYRTNYEDPSEQFPTDRVFGALVDEVKRQKNSLRFCCKHPNNNVDLFCADCSECICHACAWIGHRECSGVTSLAEEALKKRASIGKRLTKWKENVEVARRNLEEVSKVKEDLKTDYARHQNDLKKMYEKIRVCLEQSETKSLETLKQCYDPTRECLLSFQKQMEDVLKVYNSAVSLCEKSLEGDNDVDFLSQKIYRPKYVPFLKSAAPAILVTTLQDRFTLLKKSSCIDEIEKLLRKSSINTDTLTKMPPPVLGAEGSRSAIKAENPKNRPVPVKRLYIENTQIDHIDLSYLMKRGKLDHSV